MNEDLKRLETEFLESINSSSKIIHKIGRLYFKSHEEQADFSQDVLINAWRAYPKFGNKSKFSTWLYRIAINTALFHVRKQINKNNVQISEVYDSLTTDQPVNEILDKLYLAAEFLNENEKAFLALYLEDLSYDQMSDVLGLSVNLVGVRLNRLKEKLKSIIQKIK